jgi:hypothetical protein
MVGFSCRGLVIRREGREKEVGGGEGGGGGSHLGYDVSTVCTGRVRKDDDV